MNDVVKMKPAQKCAVHDWPTLGFARRLVEAMRSEGGIDTCADCVRRAREDARQQSRLRGIFGRVGL